MDWLTRHLGKLKDITEFPLKRRLDKNASDFLRKAGVSSGQTVLDFGCGSGTFTIPAAKLVERDGKVYALDVDERSLNKVRAKAEQVGIENIITMEIPQGGGIPIDDELDLILLIDVLYDVENKKALFEEAHEKLGSDGVVVVYPMHMEEEEVVKIAESAHFILKEKFRDHVLIFEKGKEFDG